MKQRAVYGVASLRCGDFGLLRYRLENISELRGMIARRQWNFRCFLVRNSTEDISIDNIISSFLLANGRQEWFRDCVSPTAIEQMMCYEAEWLRFCHPRKGVDLLWNFHLLGSCLPFELIRHLDEVDRCGGDVTRAYTTEHPTFFISSPNQPSVLDRKRAAAG